MTGVGDEDSASLLKQPATADNCPAGYGGTTSRGHDPVTSDSEFGGGDVDVQDGVREIEAVTRTWTRSGLVVAYMSIFLMAFTTSLEAQVTYPLAAFAVSSFKKHSLLSTVYVVQNLVNGAYLYLPISIQMAC
jgi:hypothetical protein